MLFPNSDHPLFSSQQKLVNLQKLSKIANVQFVMIALVATWARFGQLQTFPSINYTLWGKATIRFLLLITGVKLYVTLARLVQKRN